MTVKHSRDGVEDNDSEQPVWPYFESLLFLKDQSLPRNSTGNFDTRESEAFEETEEESAPNSVDEVTSEIESQPTTPYSIEISPSLTPKHSSSVAPLPKKARTQKIAKKNDTVGEALLKAEEEKIAYLKRKEENRNKKEEKVMDEDEAFFKSILPHVKAFSPKQKIRFRIQVMQLLDNEIPGPLSMQSIPERPPPTQFVSDSSQRNNVTPGSQHGLYGTSGKQQVLLKQIPSFQSGSNGEPGISANEGGSGEEVQVNQHLSGPYRYHFQTMQMYRDVVGDQGHKY